MIRRDVVALDRNIPELLLRAWTSALVGTSQVHTKSSVKVGGAVLNSSTDRTRFISATSPVSLFLGTEALTRTDYQYNGIKSHHELLPTKVTWRAQPPSPCSHAAAPFPHRKGWLLCAPHAHRLLSRDRLPAVKSTACDRDHSTSVRHNAMWPTAGWKRPGP